MPVTRYTCNITRAWERACLPVRAAARGLTALWVGHHSAHPHVGMQQVFTMAAGEQGLCHTPPGSPAAPRTRQPWPLCPTEAPIGDAQSHSSTRRTSLREGNHKSDATHFPQVLTATDTSHLKVLSLSPHTDLSQHRSFPNCSMIYNWDKLGNKDKVK